MDESAPRVLTCREAAERLHVSRRVIRSMIDDGTLQGFRRAKTTRVTEKSVNKLLGVGGRLAADNTGAR